MKNFENVLVSFFVGCELRDLILESGAYESDRSMDEIAQNIVEFCIDLPLELFPGEVRVSLLGPETDERIAPIFRVFELEGFIDPNADLLALGEFLSFERYLFCRRNFPR